MSDFFGIQPISKIDLVMKSIPATSRHCLLDTNILAAWSYKDVHSFGEEAELVFEKIVEFDAASFATVTTRAEFLDFIRRVLLTENLMSMIAPGSPWRISEEVRRRIDSFRRSIAARTEENHLPLLSDQQIKALKRDAFVPKDESGKDGWLKFCSLVLGTDLAKSWEELESALGLNYLDTADDSLKEILPAKPEWRNLYSVIAQTGVASSDALILNMFQASRIPILISTDFDLGYAFKASTLATQRTLLLPDKLAREVSKLRMA